ncbi:hypothetical protein [Pontibacter litorisediminis]|uniref:hypothetical protein n=1 Tax=Pontibacter litorisediminis TaxID=1846260 RepID=UPI0023EC2395|nr:hypothetical protein [Pontibacter litorisediminis]
MAFESINLKEEIVGPSYSSRPNYSTGRAGNYDFFTFKCLSCGSSIQIDLLKQIEYSWKGKTDRISEDEQSELKQHYSIGITQKSHDGGLPVFDKVLCSKCSASYFTYCGVSEFSNSAYNVFVQGIVKI